MSAAMTNCASGILQGIRFGLVGLAATLTHAGILWVLVEGYQISALVATLLGFLVAFVMSYLGHFYITFQSERSHTQTLPRFALVAIGGASLHGLIFFVAIDLIGWHYWYAFAIPNVPVPGILVFVWQRLISTPLQTQ